MTTVSSPIRPNLAEALPFPASLCNFFNATAFIVFCVARHFEFKNRWLRVSIINRVYLKSDKVWSWKAVAQLEMAASSAHAKSPFVAMKGREASLLVQVPRCTLKGFGSLISIAFPDMSFVASPTCENADIRHVVCFARNHRLVVDNPIEGCSIAHSYGSQDGSPWRSSQSSH